MSTKGATKAYYLLAVVCMTANIAAACNGHIREGNKNAYREQGLTYPEALTKEQVDEMEEGPLKEMYLFVEQFNVYFLNAVMTWLLKDDDAARLAAFGAAQTAERTQRQSMANALNGIADELERYPNETNAELAAFGVDAQEAKDRLEWFALEITRRDWSIAESVETRKMLDTIDPVYSDALDIADALVFCARYPDIAEMLICEY